VLVCAKTLVFVRRRNTVWCGSRHLCVCAEAEPVLVGLKILVCVYAAAETVFVGLKKFVYAAAEPKLVRLNKCVCVCG